jgi:hypothetical protein
MSDDGDRFSGEVREQIGAADEAEMEDNGEERETQTEVGTQPEVESEDESASGTASDGGAAADAGPSNGSGSDSDAAAPTADDEVDLTTPAFDYDRDMQENFYVHPDALQEFEDVRRFEIERLLAQYGVRDPTGREIDTAVIEVICEHYEEVVERVLDRRGLSVDVTDG